MKPVDPGTSRAQIEQELRESEERYSALFTHNYSVSLLIDPDTGRIVDANDAAVRYYGYPRNLLTTMGIFDLNRLPEESVVKNLRRAKTEREKHFFSSHYLANGSKRYVEIYSGPITVQGKPLFYSIIHDITDRRLMEEELRKASRYNRSLIEASLDPLVTIGPDGRITDVNAATERVTGYSRDRLVGTDFSDYFTEPDKARAIYLQVFSDGEVRDYPLEIHHHNGMVTPVLYNASLYRNDDGGIVGIFAAARDITVRKKTETALQESEERYRTLIDRLPDYVIVHREGILLYINRAAASRIGYSADALMGKHLLEFVAPDCRNLLIRSMKLRMEGLEIPPYEIRIIAGDGTRRTVLVNGAYIQYQGSPASLNVLTDITTLKAAEESIREANEQLEIRVAERTEALQKTNVQLEEEVVARRKAEQEIGRSLAEKELLLREIHHRVKNNLQIIISLLNLQSRYIHDQKILDAIQDSQNRVRAMSLIHERIYRSHSIATINLNDYIRYLVNQLFGFYAIQSSQVRATVTMEDIPVDIDMATPIGLILNELITNSIKHAFPEGRAGQITIGCTLISADTLRLVYQDNGDGLPPGFDWRNTESLGLRLVNSLVDQLDGTIEQGAGPGTIFIITLHRKGNRESKS